MQEQYASVIIWPICGEGSRPSSIFNEPAVFPSTEAPCQPDGTKLWLNPPKVFAYQMAKLMNSPDTVRLFHTILNMQTTAMWHELAKQISHLNYGLMKNSVCRLLNALYKLK